MALGLGDALLGLVAVGGLKKKNPTKKIRYRINPGTMDFVRLFDGGYDDLAGHTGEKASSSPGDLQINNGYDEEMRTRGAVPRWERYCRNIGAREPVLPILRERQRLLDLGQHDQGVVCLSPFSAYQCRQWPLHSWLTLAKLLQGAGYRPVVLDDVPGRSDRFSCEKVIRRPADVVTSIVLNASCLVGNDSGLAHLSGILGQPTIVLAGQVDPAKIYGVYPKMTYLRGPLSCQGCYWQGPEYEGPSCGLNCAALGAITPAQVLKEVQRLTRPRKIETIKHLKPFRVFTDADEAESVRHMNEDVDVLYKRGGNRYICSILGALYEELAERPDLRRLVCECTWIARRMNDHGRNQADLDWRRDLQLNPPKPT
jgi:hypothetical protein